MTDERDDTPRPGVYDDDRLLACVLGLQEDPELLTAAAADPDLGARLEAMRADVAQVGAQVAAAVPAPDEGYADLSGDRWSALTEFFQPPAEAAGPRRQRRWWRVVAPAAALIVLALVVGIVAINGGETGSGSMASEGARSADGAAPAQSTAGGDTAESENGATLTPSIPERFVDEMQRFAVVVLARAREVTGAVQRFAVLRIFKGEAPKVVEIVVDGRPADTGRLHLLMLEPTAPPATQTASPWPLGQSPEAVVGSPLPETTSPAPTVSPAPVPSMVAADGGPGVPLTVSYTYHGAPVMVRELAAGTDPQSVTITIP